MNTDLTQTCKIAYHGTDADTAKQILESGAFRTGTYFAFRIEDAIKFGGPCVFVVKFSEDPKHWKGESDGWQFHLREAYSTDNILEKTDGVTNPTQIPASVIPELAEFLTERANDHSFDAFAEHQELIDNFTAALEAFNDRETK